MSQVRAPGNSSVIFLPGLIRSYPRVAGQILIRSASLGLGSRKGRMSEFRLARVCVWHDLAGEEWGCLAYPGFCHRGRAEVTIC